MEPPWIWLVSVPQTLVELGPVEYGGWVSTTASVMYLKPSQSSVAGGCVPVVVGSCDLRTYFHGLYWLWLKWGYMSHLHKYHNQRFPSRMLHCNQVISVIYITCLSVVLMLCLMVCIGVCSVSVYCLILVPSTGWSFLPSALLRELLCWHHLN